MIDKISQEDMDKLKELRTLININQVVADKAAAEARVSVLERQSFIQHMFLRYGLTINDSIDENTGVIKRTPVEPQIPVSEEIK